MRIYSRLYSNCQIILVFDKRVQSKMGVGYSFTRKINKKEQ